MNPNDRNLAIWHGALSDILPMARQAIQESIDLQYPPIFADFVADLFDQAVALGIDSLWPGSSLIVRAVTTPELCSLPDALRLARAAARFDDRLDSKILRHLATPARNWPESATDADIL